MQLIAQCYHYLFWGALLLLGAGLIAVLVYIIRSHLTVDRIIGINLIGTLGGPTVTGFIVLILAMVLGHTLNLALNLLGAFVHTARLQYIEFFGKFYIDGGEPFKPAAVPTKYTEIIKEAK